MNMNAEPLSVLIVDDMAMYRKLLKNTVESLRHAEARATAPNAEIALKKLSRDPYDLVLLDVWMPDTDGITLLKEWTQQPESEERLLDTVAAVLHRQGASSESSGVREELTVHVDADAWSRAGDAGCTAVREWARGMCLCAGAAEAPATAGCDSSVGTAARSVAWSGWRT